MVFGSVVLGFLDSIGPLLRSGGSVGLLFPVWLLMVLVVVVGWVVVLMLCAEAVLDHGVPGVLIRYTVEYGSAMGVASDWRLSLEE